MEITAVFVTSLDGKITRGNEENIYSWTSPDDSAHFFSLIQKNSLIIMGSATYRASQDKIKLTPQKLRIVMTHHPEQYSSEEVSGQLEFHNDSPSDLIIALQKRGYVKALFVGGAQVFQEFLKQQLITSLSLTIEPLVFGTGTPLFDTDSLIRLNLKSVTKLNKQGTLLLTYTIV